jgi:hypothetical protein
MTTYSLIKSCLSCTSCGRSTHRHGRTAWVCRRFGFDIDASTVPGETISCDRFEPRMVQTVAICDKASMPAYLL